MSAMATWRGSLVLAAVLATGGGAAGEGPRPPEDEPAVIQNLQARATRTLNGTWQTIVDPMDHGWMERNKTIRPADDPAGFWQANRPRRPLDLVEFEFDHAQTLEVPGDWNSQRPELLYYEGTVWYRRTFVHEPGEGRRVFLASGGANTRVRAWVNKQEVGRSEEGFIPFSFEITEAVRPGENEVIFMVDNRRVAHGVPAIVYDWWNYGGLTRDVAVVETPETFIRQGEIRLAPGTRDTVEGWAILDGPRAAGAQVRLVIPEAGIEAAGVADERGVASFRAKAPRGLDLWAPGAPRMYDAAFETGGDRLPERVGFREISTDGRRVTVNGEPIFLRGISIHEEAPLREGRAWSKEDAGVLLGWAKELGCNYVRLAHYPHAEPIVRLADEMGLLVWAEIPVYWELTFGDPRTLEWARTQLRTMMARDRSRACVGIWSIGNEVDSTPERDAFRIALGREVKRADPTRLLSAALWASYLTSQGPGGEERRALHIDDPFGEVADVLAINEYVGWYGGGSPDSITGRELTAAWEKPILISELGAGVKQGLRGDRATRFTEEHGVWFYERQLAWAAGQERLAGLSPWILRDFRSPRRLLHGVQDGYNRKGLISERGVRKDVFFVLQRFYRETAAREEAARSAPRGD